MMSYSEKFLRGLLPFIYCCDACGHVYHADKQVANNDPHICDDCRPCKVEKAGCVECGDELACYAERPSPARVGAE
jgi:hypothetical protein